MNDYVNFFLYINIHKEFYVFTLSDLLQVIYLFDYLEIIFSVRCLL